MARELFRKKTSEFLEHEIEDWLNVRRDPSSHFRPRVSKVFYDRRVVKDMVARCFLSGKWKISLLPDTDPTRHLLFIEGTHESDSGRMQGSRAHVYKKILQSEKDFAAENFFTTRRTYAFALLACFSVSFFFAGWLVRQARHAQKESFSVTSAESID